jgi:glycine reductase
MIIRTVHYVNQFFGRIGGEEKAGIPPLVLDGPVGVGVQIEEEFKGRIRIVKTIVCGDNHAAENIESVSSFVLDEIRSADAGFFIAGPSFGAGRYGTACALFCREASKSLRIPVITAMHPVSPGVDLAKRDLYIVETADSARDMKNALSKIVALGTKILDGSPIGLPAEEGYIPRGIRINVREKERGSKRAVGMLLAKIKGEPFTTELPMPFFDHVPPAPAIENLKTAVIAIGTEGGIVPKGNPDRIEAHNASKWRSYRLSGIDRLAGGEYEVAHGGYDPVAANEDPNRVLPLDAARACQKESEFASLYDSYPVTVGNVTAVRSAEKYGREIGEMLKKDGVDGIVLTST